MQLKSPVSRFGWYKIFKVGACACIRRRQLECCIPTYFRWLTRIIMARIEGRSPPRSGDKYAEALRPAATGALRNPVRSRERLRTALRSGTSQPEIGEARPSCSCDPRTRSHLSVPAMMMFQRTRREQLGLLQRPQRELWAPPASSEPVEIPHQISEARCYEFLGQRSEWWQGQCDLGRTSESGGLAVDNERVNVACRLACAMEVRNHRTRDA
jgi:hypothetical protein